MTDYVLEGILKLDSSEFERGLKGAKSLASGVMEGLTVAIGAATTAMGAFAVSAVNTGQQFDKSMSQVAATMGKTTEEIGDLREFAQEMGRTTAFSATEAADALNYMALAGYDAQTSMEMLPNVLNLAAAGNMDLARASDMVTDTQTAFGISLERTTQMVDEMAKAASTGNTSVEQLGDAFLTVGGLAQELNGGMVTLEDGTSLAYDNVQELEIALTAMANAGIKGSEAGTHMRNMLLKLSSPTDAGVKQLQALGVSVFDAEGNMRSLAAIMEDLGGAMDNLTQEQKLQAISDLFNTRDTAAAEALLKAVDEDWTDIAESILDADGAAQKMADTQLDNLAGDVTLFKSALEGAQIAVSDGITPKLREFVKLGTKGLSEVTDAFQKDGLDGAIKAFGDILSEGITLILAKAPEMVRAGIKLFSALVKGFAQNRKQMAQAVKELFAVITETLSEEFPQLKQFFDGVQGIVDGLFSFIEAHGSEVISVLKGVLSGFLAYKTTIVVFDEMKTGITAVSTAVKILNGEMALSALVNPYTAIAAAVGVLVGVLVASADANEKSKQKLIELSESQQAILDSSHAYAESMANIREENERLAGSIDSQFANEAALIDELKSITDENGVVMDGYEERAAQITGELSNAFGVEIQYTDGVISNYKDIVGQLDQILERKKLQALIDANAGQYSDAYGKQVELLNNLTTAQTDYNNALKDAEQAEANDAQLHRDIEAALKDENMARADYLSTQIDDSRNAAEVARGHADETKKMLDEASKAYAENQNFISEMDAAYEAATDTTKDAGEAFHNLTNGLIEDGPAEVMAQQVADVTEELQGLLEAQQQGAQISDETIAQTTEKLAEAIALMTGDDFEEMAKNIPAGTAEGIAEHDDVIEAAKTMISDAEAASKEQGGINSPSTVFMEIGRYLVEGLRNGLQSGFPVVISFLKNKISEMTKLFTDFVGQALTWGSDLIGNFVSGIQAKWGDLTTAVAGAAQVVADNLGFSEPKEGPLSDFHTYAPDMMKLFAEGIKDNAYLVRDQMAESLSMETVTQNVTPPNNSEIISLLQQIRDEGRVEVTLEGDADRLFRAMQRKATANYRLTGNPGMVMA